MVLNKINNIRTIIVVLIIFSTTLIQSQVKISKVNNRIGATEKEGFFYSLPQTHLKIELIVQRVEKIAGPLAPYAEKYLGVAGVEQSNFVKYIIKDVRLSTFSQPDPTQLYFVQLDKRSKEPQQFILSLDESGLIMGVNKRVENMAEIQELVDIKVKTGAKTDYFKYFADYNFYKQTDTIVRRISIDTFSIEKYNYNVSLVEKDPVKKAAELAQKLKKLREDRYLLLTGFQEINYGGSLSYMDGELKKMEAAYLALFTGYTKTEYIYKSFTLIPDNAQISKNIAAFRFSEAQGVFEATESRASNVYLKYTANQSTQDIQKFLSTAIPEKDNSVTGYFYRVPEYGVFEIILDGVKIHSSNHLISQFGKVVQTPSLNTELEFHPNTGSLKQIKLK